MAVGAAVINFGSFPGSNEASIAVTGQAAILGTSYVEAFVMAEATADHSINDHKYLDLFAEFTVGDLIAGTGFTIHGRSEERLQGTFNLRWVWSS